MSPAPSASPEAPCHGGLKMRVTAVCNTHARGGGTWDTGHNMVDNFLPREDSRPQDKTQNVNHTHALLCRKCVLDAHDGPGENGHSGKRFSNILTWFFFMGVRMPQSNWSQSLRGSGHPQNEFPKPQQVFGSSHFVRTLHCLCVW